MGIDDLVRTLHSISLSHLPVYVISLPCKRTRFIKVKEQLRRIGLLNVIHIEAVDTKTAYSHRHSFFSINVLNNITRGPFSTNMIPTWNAAACALSHLCAWEQAQHHDLCLVVEDDLLIQNPDKILFMLMEAIHMHTTTIPSELHLFFFNSKKRNNALYCYDTPPPLNGSPSYNSLFSSASSSWLSDSPLCLPSFARLGDSFIDSSDLIGSHFYLLSGVAAKIMLKNVYPIEFQIDIHMTKILRKKCLLQVYYTRCDAGVLQDPSYKISTVQYYSIPGAYTLYMILDQKFPIEVCSTIYSFCKPWYEFYRM
jgi:GR25 family glycosyltransferase involved in LPS biosynthesis